MEKRLLSSFSILGLRAGGGGGVDGQKQRTLLGVVHQCNPLRNTTRRSSALFWGITRRRVVIVYRRFGTTYRSVFQGQESSRTLDP
jgi:hypothetical protein